MTPPGILSAGRRTAWRLRALGILLASGIGVISVHAQGALPPNPSTRVALVGATVISATGAAPIPDATVLTEGRRIVSVTPRNAAVLPKGTRVIDATGMFITPGLIEANVHLVLMITPEFYVKYAERMTDIAMQSAQVALKYGLTTIMPGMDIIIAATRHGAEADRLADSLGTVQVGKVAELLVLNADPSADVRNLRRIHQVFKAGLLVDRAALPSVRVLQ